MKELQKNELMEVNGGYTRIPSWVKGSLWVAIGFYIIDNWADIKSGIIDGWAAAMKD
ncbi:MAG: class IIb bacteriocin, lactobin A/cerein 7B family [Bacteroidia bacterium]|nr:class IIb bacteriocin, lactobin A/cerein 7B family [Bacteroidia bacterium]